MDDIRYIKLFDLYKDLLTEKQRELFSSHYFFDLSLSEIAEPEGTTRQSVHDAIKKVKLKLDELEEELHLLEKTDALEEIANSVADSDLSAKIKEIIGR